MQTFRRGGWKFLLTRKEEKNRHPEAVLLLKLGDNNGAQRTSYEVGERALWRLHVGRLSSDCASGSKVAAWAPEFVAGGKAVGVQLFSGALRFDRLLRGRAWEVSFV
jgi:hypothetical protein